MPHDAPAGHNRPADHLHSHPHEDSAADDLQALAAQFIDGFRQAADKAAFLTLAGIPQEIADDDGGPPLKLVDVSVRSDWQVGTASPSFGSRELTWLPFPGAMISERTNMEFTYVSLDRKAVRDLRTVLAARL